MARRIKPPDALPSKAWLMSFGDTMTTLLAFFIVLVSLAEDQTGVNLHAGTGSFMRTIKSGGMPGVFPGNKSKRAFQMDASSPLYRTTGDKEASGDGPDEESDVQSRDGEQEAFNRFLNEMERMASVDTGAVTTGETTFDFFDKLTDDPPYAPASLPRIIVRIIPVLRRPNYRVELIVWAPTPSPSAISRATVQSNALRREILAKTRIPAAANRLTGLARTWPYKDVKRPVMSVVFRRVR